MNRHTRKAEDISFCDSGKHDTIAVIFLLVPAARSLVPHARRGPFRGTRQRGRAAGDSDSEVRQKDSGLESENYRVSFCIAFLQWF